MRALTGDGSLRPITIIFALAELLGTLLQIGRTKWGGVLSPDSTPLHAQCASGRECGDEA